MPQNIVVGADAQKVAAFVAKYAGRGRRQSAGAGGHDHHGRRRSQRAERSHARPQADPQRPRAGARGAGEAGRGRAARRAARRRRAAPRAEHADRRDPGRAEQALGRDRGGRAGGEDRRPGVQAGPRRLERAQVRAQGARAAAGRARTRSATSCSPRCRTSPSPRLRTGRPRRTTSPSERWARCRSSASSPSITSTSPSATAGSRWRRRPRPQARDSPTCSATWPCSSSPWSASRWSGCAPRASSRRSRRCWSASRRSTAPATSPGEREMIYEIPRDELFLVGTSEVSLASLHADQIMEAERPAEALRGLLDLLSARGRSRGQGHARDLPGPPVRQGRDVQLRRARLER